MDAAKSKCAIAAGVIALLLGSACATEPIPVPTPVPPVPVAIDAPPGLRDLVATAPEGAVLSWTVNGVSAEGLADTVPAERLYPGDLWQVQAVQGDAVGTASHIVPDPPGGNVLVLLLDDVGIDKVGAYGWDTAAKTPQIDALAEAGVRFDRAYASPVCSPTRGSLLTGRQPRRHGIGWIIDTGSRAHFLPFEATTVPEMLWEARGLPYSDGAIGKWHLAGRNAPDWLRHPLDSGFSHFVGAPGNPRYQPGTGYYVWDKNDNGTLIESTTYMTTDTADEALARIDSLAEPWFVYVAFNAPHTPLDLPPEHLVEQMPEGNLTSAEKYDLVLEAVDTEIGRLLEGLGEQRERTTVITLGDNGTSDHGVPEDVDEGRNKHTPYEGGIRIPLIVTGPLVPEPATTEALVHVVDIFPTVADIAGIPIREAPLSAAPVFSGSTVLLDTPVDVDGRSLLPFLSDPDAPSRPVIYVEALSNGAPPYSIDRRTVVTPTHKLVRWLGQDEFYALEGPYSWDLAQAPVEVDETIRADLTTYLDAVDALYPHEGF